MAKMYRCEMRFVWINYSRIRLVRLRKHRDSFLRKCGRSLRLTIHLHLEQRLRISEAPTTLFLYVFVARAGAILPLPVGLNPGMPAAWKIVNKK
jgi:hypothetical protein